MAISLTLQTVVANEYSNVAVPEADAPMPWLRRTVSQRGWIVLAAAAVFLGAAVLDLLCKQRPITREQWQTVNSTLHGIWRALSVPGPASHAASVATLSQEA